MDEENARSPMSLNSSDEEKHCLDPSNPLTHSKNISRKDQGDGKNTIDSHVEGNQKVKSTIKTPRTLSKWASKYLTPNKCTKEIVEPPIEPMQDYILKEFSDKISMINKNQRKDEHDTIVSPGSNDLDDDPEEEIELAVGLPLGSPSTEMEKPITKKTPGSAKNTGSESRYFRCDVTIRCFNCGEVGHASWNCVNEKVKKPCHYCGSKDHDAAFCHNLRCFSCCLPGHQTRNCPNRDVPPNFCSICGKSDHRRRECHVLEDSFLGVRCMTCGKPGHSSCMALPLGSNMTLFCANCGGNHRITECLHPRGPTIASSHREYASSRNGSTSKTPNKTGRSDKTCFTCSEMGHVAADCPKRPLKNGREYKKCFMCSKVGHLASNCPTASRNKSNRRAFVDKPSNFRNSEVIDIEAEHQTGRKRRRSGGHGNRRLSGPLDTTPHQRHKRRRNE